MSWYELLVGPGVVSCAKTSSCAAVTIVFDLTSYCSIATVVCIWYIGFLPPQRLGPLAGAISGKTAVIAEKESISMMPEMSRRVGTTSALEGLQWQRSLQMLQSLQALGLQGRKCVHDHGML